MAPAWQIAIGWPIVPASHAPSATASSAAASRARAGASGGIARHPVDPAPGAPLRDPDRDLREQAPRTPGVVDHHATVARLRRRSHAELGRQGEQARLVDRQPLPAQVDDGVAEPAVPQPPADPRAPPARSRRRRVDEPARIHQAG
ncbi:MAG TPA: hypothetical protein VHN14_36600 [Kofleriaceae bacterium]|nr:hypothetical protein [Kofleriaceae bacterium]